MTPNGAKNPPCEAAGCKRKSKWQFNGFVHLASGTTIATRHLLCKRHATEFEATFGEQPIMSDEPS